MNFEPQKFFIGIIDLFSILLPGAVIAYLAKQSGIVATMIPLEIGPGAEGWLAFFFASYLIGHLVFLAGAKLDDWVYDPLAKNGTYLGQINRLKDGKGLSAPALRWTAGKLFKAADERALMQVLRIKAMALAQLADPDAVNAFQWSKALLSKHHPAGLAAVERFEADSKFFRSFAVALLLLAVILTALCRLWPAVLCALLLLPVLWRYVNQRKKAIQQAYRFVISLGDLNGTDSDKPFVRPTDAPTHAGGAVYRVSGDKAEYLIIQAERIRSEWVLPKGHIEPGEEPRATAVREAREETGHWARVRAAVGTYRLGESDTAPLTRFYLMECLEAETIDPTMFLAQDRRGQQWMLLDAAVAQLNLSHPESGTVLRDADALRHRLLAKKEPAA